MMLERRIRWLRTLQGAVLLCAVWAAGLPWVEARVALVVGNSAYQHTSPLANPSNDAEDMARQLRQLGFEVIEGRNLTQAGFYDHLRRFSVALRTTKGEAALFFYAGHGMQDNDGQNHLVPVDSPMRDEWDVPKMVRFDYVMDAMKGFPGLKLVFLDACRDNPLRGARSLAGGAKRGLAPVKRAPDSGGQEEGSGTLIMYATAPDDTAADGEGRNSPFTEALLKHVGTPGLEVGPMLERVVGTVKERTRRTGKQQVPWISASKSGRFFFVAGSGGSGITGGSSATADTIVSSSEARAAYELAEKIHTRAAYEAITTSFPGTVYAHLAEAQIRKLTGGDGDGRPDPPSGQKTEAETGGSAEDEASRRRAAVEDAYWEKCEKNDSAVYCEDYLAEYEDGAYARLAQRRLAEITEAKRKREEAARRKAEAEAKRREAEARRKAEEERRRAEEQRIAELTPEIVSIEGGSFWMGSLQSEERRYDDERRRLVRVEGFSIGKYEVTFAEYDRFAEATGRSSPYDEGWGRGRRPVIDVSWDDATAYARWLSEETGRQYRLPTEAEWEYAARAGTETAYPWGDRVGHNKANCDGCGSRWDDKQTAPVGSFEANAWGLHDTVGNVWEWTCSEYDEGYGGAEKRCATGTGSAGRLVLRGGSWNYGPRWVRSAYRSMGGAGDRDSYLGFRLVQD